MIEQEEFFVAVIALLVIYLGILMRFQSKLLDLLDELAFPSNDPIMTSSLKEPVFEYEDSEEEEEEAPVDSTPEEAVEFTPEEEPEVFEYEIDLQQQEDWQANAYVDPEVVEAEEAKTRSTIPFHQPDFPPVTLAQLKRLPKAELVDLCVKYEKETDGTKADLLNRLIG